MRRLVALVALLALLSLGLVAVVALRSQAIPADCMVVGTAIRNVETGTRRDEVFCVLAGDDYVHGKAGDDTIRAGQGNDTAIGGTDRDRLNGGGGNDQLFTVDERGGDRVIAGTGKDRCYIDPGDHTFGCERVFFSYSPQMAKALQSALLVVMGIAENVVPTPTLPPPGGATTVTVTVTRAIGPGFCDENPPDPPPFCQSPSP